MKKLLLFLLLPFAVAAQDLYLDHSYIDAPPFNVGDTITVKFNTLDNNESAFNLLVFDYEYNNKLLQKVEHSFSIPTGASSSLTHWDGWKFNPDSNFNKQLLKDQYEWWAQRAGSNSYSSNSDWSVERITIQHSSAIPHNDTFVIVKFIIKDKANSNYTNYSNVTSLSWARAENQSSALLYDVKSLSHHVSLNEVKGGDAGSVVLNLKTQNDKPEAYMYSIFDENNSSIDSGYFDASGQATITGLENDTEYGYFVSVDTGASSEWLGNIVTATDVFLAFKEAAAVGEGPMDNAVTTFDYEIQNVTADIDRDDDVDFEDSYGLFTHLVGEAADDLFITNDSIAYDINQYNKPLKPTDNDKSFDVYHYFQGDVDLSHSYIPQEQTTTARFSLFNSQIPVHDLDLVTELINNKVVLTVNIDRKDLGAIQFIVSYDKQKIAFDEIIFDSGDNMTNYSSHKNNTIYFGSIDVQNGLSVKPGESFKIVFTPKVNLTNTAGLVYFKQQEAVTTAGQKIKLNLY